MIAVFVVVSILNGLLTSEDFEMEMAKVFRVQIEHAGRWS